MLLACRLCLRLGIEDPEQWLEDVPDRVFNLWESYYQVEPWGNELERLADIGAATMARLLSSGVDAKEACDAVTQLRASKMPACWVDQPEPLDIQSHMEAVQAQIERQFGG